MPCRTTIEKHIDKQIKEDIASTSVGTREAVRKSAQKLSEKYKVKGSFRPWEYQSGVYRVAFIDRFLPDLIEKEYTKRYIIENELEKKSVEEHGEISVQEISLTPVKEIADPVTGQLSFTDHSFHNGKELTKDGKSIDQVQSQLYTEKFEEYFPDYSYYTKEDREFFIEELLGGKIEITCKI
jgi:hypothetical protein